MEQEGTKPLIVVVGASAAVAEALEEFAACADLAHVPEDVDRILEGADGPAPALVVCAPPSVLPVVELAQVLRTIHPDAPAFLAATERTDFDRKVFKKNGFTDAFLLPFDRPVLRDAIAGILAGRGRVKAFRPVKIGDVPCDVPLDFETFLYLPRNDRYVKLSRAGRPLDRERLERMKGLELLAVHISAEDRGKFDRLFEERSAPGARAVSATERAERFGESVRDLVSDLFNRSSASVSMDAGRAFIAESRRIAALAVPAADAGPADWYGKWLSACSVARGPYDHFVNVSAFAALFSAMLGIGIPEELAMAGLLHDVGLAALPAPAPHAREETLSGEERERMRRHPQTSLSILRGWRMSVPDAVARAILEHHERYDGSGYPENLGGPQIAPEAQLIAIADELDESISGVRDGTPASPAAALERLFAENLTDLARAKFDPGLLKKMRAALKPGESAA